ncbi:MAG: hypothetical protein AAGI53_08975 [Planctomycetota bacterium]
MVGTTTVPSPRGKRRDLENFSQTLARANRAAGLPWTRLDYRHAFGSRLAQNGVSLYQTSKLMGNSLEICRRHYAALTPETMGARVEFSPGSITQGDEHASIVSTPDDT